MRLARMIAERGIFRTFPWAKHTIFNERFYDIHFLYHVLLIPFTVGNPVIGGKIASVLLGALAVGLLARFMSRNGIRYGFFWSLFLLFGSSAFLGRMVMVRPISLSVIFFILALHVLFRGDYRWMALLAYLFVLAYNGFPMLVVIVVTYTVCRLVYDRKLEYRPLLYCLAGLAAGMVLNPYFPNNFRILFVQFVRGPLTRSLLESNLEWLPVSTWSILLGSAGVVIALFAVFYLVLRKKAPCSFNTVYLFVQAVVFLLLYAKYARGIDQFVPFAVLFCAFAVSEIKIRREKLALIVMTAFLIINMGVNLFIAGKVLSGSDRIDNAGSAAWLRDNTPQGSEVFIANYGAFTQLFYYNQNNYYTLGLDPLYMREHDPRLYDLYQDAIWLRRDPYPVIAREFGASWVHVENISRSREFYGYLESSPHLYRRVFQDDFSAIYEVRR